MTTKLVSACPRLTSSRFGEPREAARGLAGAILLWATLWGALVGGSLLFSELSGSATAVASALRACLGL